VKAVISPIAGAQTDGLWIRAGISKRIPSWRVKPSKVPDAKAQIFIAAERFDSGSGAQNPRLFLRTQVLSCPHQSFIFSSLSLP
jgi:hypothetical protein